MPEPIRVYADTSVFGGVFDEEFHSASRTLLDKVLEGRFRLVVSRLVEEEIEGAPVRVRSFFGEFRDNLETNAVPEEAVRLQQAYLAHGIVGEGSMADALHVALATVLACQVIVSWNFKHIVHYQKIPLYNAVNRLMGRSEIGIHTPLEVIADEDENL